MSTLFGLVMSVQTLVLEAQSLMIHVGFLEVGISYELLRTPTNLGKSDSSKGNSAVFF